MGGKTIALLLTMCQSIRDSGRVVILDSGFCVVQGIIELLKIGVFAGAYIKKRRFWPRFVKGDAIDEKMAYEKVGTIRTVGGIVESIRYYIFNLKEPDYTSKIMATYGSNTETSTETTRRNQDGTKTRFRYNSVFENHFKYRHAVDDHNNHRHTVPSIETTWKTHQWECRQFQYLLATTEVNTWLALRHFLWKGNESKTKTLLEFRRELSQQMIDNDWLDSDESSNSESSEWTGTDESSTGGRKRKRSKRSERLFLQQPHDLVTCPRHAQKYLSSGTWILNAKDPYQKHVCTTLKCKKFVRTYCSCGVGHWMCVDCWGNHRESVGYTEGALGAN